MNSWEIYKVLLICILFGYRFDLISCADSQGGTDGGGSTPSNPSSPATPAKSQDNCKSPTKVDLNIETDKQTTDSYDYAKDDPSNTATYTCKAGHGISSVKQGDKQIWKGGEKECANKVLLEGVGKKKQILTIHFPNEKIIEFTKPDKFCGMCSGEWPATPVVKREEKIGLDPKDHPAEVKVTTEDSNGTSKENDTDKYKVYKREGADEYEYKFNQNVKCTAIKCSDKEVWKRETSGGASDNPDSFTYNKTDNSFILYFGLEYIKFTKDTSTDSWKGSERESIIKLTTEGSDGKSSENDKSKYDTSNPNPDTFEFKFKDGAKCTKVTHLDKEVWKYGTTTSTTGGGATPTTPESDGSQGTKTESGTPSTPESGGSQGTKTESGGAKTEGDGSQSGTPTTPASTPTTPTSGGTPTTPESGTPTTPSGGTTATPPYPKSIQYNKKDNVYTIEFESGSITYRLNGDKWEENTGSILDVAKAKDDDKDSRFTKTIQGMNWIHFTIKADTKITEVRCDGKEVWKQDTSKNDDFYKGHPTKVEYKENPPMIEITIDNKVDHGYVTRNGEWKRREMSSLAR